MSVATSASQDFIGIVPTWCLGNGFRRFYLRRALVEASVNVAGHRVVLEFDIRSENRRANLQTKGTPLMYSEFEDVRFHARSVAPNVACLLRVG